MIKGAWFHLFLTPLLQWKEKYSYSKVIVFIYSGWKMLCLGHCWYAITISFEQSPRPFQHFNIIFQFANIVYLRGQEILETITNKKFKTSSVTLFIIFTSIFRIPKSLLFLDLSKNLASSELKQWGGLYFLLPLAPFVFKFIPKIFSQPKEIVQDA